MARKSNSYQLMLCCPKMSCQVLGLADNRGVIGVGESIENNTNIMGSLLAAGAQCCLISTQRNVLSARIRYPGDGPHCLIT